MNIDDDGVFTTVHEDSFENILDNSSSNNRRMMIIENNNDFNDMVESRNDGLMRIGNDDVNDTIGMEEFKEEKVKLKKKLIKIIKLKRKEKLQNIKL